MSGHPPVPVSPVCEMSRRGKDQTAVPDQDGARLPHSAKESVQWLFAKANYKEHASTTPHTKLSTLEV